VAYALEGRYFLSEEKDAVRAEGVSLTFGLDQIENVFGKVNPNGAAFDGSGCAGTVGP